MRPGADCRGRSLETLHGEQPWGGEVGQILGAAGKVTAVEQISDPGGPPLELPEEPAKRGGKGAKKR